ncbi:hypothetical protein CXF80_05045 [Shewanella sp. Actino-trap-3]|nr:hypothetical protein CXF80_05045 [Shewanella sp. Actino-trap-3]
MARINHPSTSIFKLPVSELIIELWLLLFTGFKPLFVVNCPLAIMVVGVCFSVMEWIINPDRLRQCPYNPHSDVVTSNQ